ncbi:MAG: hypothetical protein QOE70_4996 [Chthoniobacter sp.]|nr:hypothetical protein [Chthoniobacter sp.]
MNAPLNTAPAAPAKIPAPRRRSITALARIYLEVGLPLPAAVQAAIADYASFGEDEEPDQSLCAA